MKRWRVVWERGMVHGVLFVTAPSAEEAKESVEATGVKVVLVKPDTKDPS